MSVQTAGAQAQLIFDGNWENSRHGRKSSLRFFFFLFLFLCFFGVCFVFCFLFVCLFVCLFVFCFGSCESHSKLTEEMHIRFSV